MDALRRTLLRDRRRRQQPEHLGEYRKGIGTGNERLPSGRTHRVVEPRDVFGRHSDAGTGLLQRLHERRHVGDESRPRQLQLAGPGRCAHRLDRFEERGAEVGELDHLHAVVIAQLGDLRCIGLALAQEEILHRHRLRRHRAHLLQALAEERLVQAIADEEEGVRLEEVLEAARCVLVGQSRGISRGRVQRLVLPRSEDDRVDAIDGAVQVPDASTVRRNRQLVDVGRIVVADRADLAISERPFQDAIVVGRNDERRAQLPDRRDEREFGVARTAAVEEFLHHVEERLAPERLHREFGGRHRVGGERGAHGRRLVGHPLDDEPRSERLDQSLPVGEPKLRRELTYRPDTHPGPDEGDECSGTERVDQTLRKFGHGVHHTARARGRNSPHHASHAPGEGNSARAAHGVLLLCHLPGGRSGNLARGLLDCALHALGGRLRRGFASRLRERARRRLLPPRERCRALERTTCRRGCQFPCHGLPTGLRERARSGALRGLRCTRISENLSGRCRDSTRGAAVTLAGDGHGVRAP